MAFVCSWGWCRLDSLVFGYVGLSFVLAQYVCVLECVLGGWGLDRFWWFWTRFWFDRFWFSLLFLLPNLLCLPLPCVILLLPPFTSELAYVYFLPSAELVRLLTLYISFSCLLYCLMPAMLNSVLAFVYFVFFLLFWTVLALLCWTVSLACVISFFLLS